MASSVYKHIKIMASYLRCFIILFIMLKLGELMVYYFKIPIPASIVGLILLFISLNTRLISVEWIKLGCSFVMKYMTLLFIPASMGVMEHYHYILHAYLPMLIGIIGSSIMTFIIVSLLTDYILNKKKQHHHAKNE